MICKIRKWSLEDAADLAAIISSKNIQDRLRDGLPYPYTEEDGRAYISFLLSEDADETFAFAITADDRVVGSIGVFRQGNIHRQTAELGYYIAEEYWGKGLMTEAVRQICAYVFEKSDVIRIYAEPFAFNAASCRVLEKAGFQYEGTLRNNAVKNGNVIDMKMYSLLKGDTGQSDAESVRSGPESAGEESVRSGPESGRAESDTQSAGEESVRSEPASGVPARRMRRRDREVTEFEELVAIMEECDVCRICMNGDGYPYIIPLNFGMTVREGRVTLYFHSAAEGLKLKRMERDPRVSFEMDCAHELLTEEDTGNCTMNYKSVIGQGRIEFLAEEEKEAALNVLMAHYHREDFSYNRAVMPQTMVYRLIVERMTGKRRQKNLPG